MKKHMRHHSIALLCITGILSAFVNPLSLQAQAAGDRPPNIVFILVDDLGWGELGTYGNTFNETPHLDQLAAEGIRFTQAYAAAPVCSPTRASIMTGQYPARVGITDFLPGKTSRYLAPDSHVTLNEALGTAGYRSALIGKWHLDTDFGANPGGPDKHGFDEVIGTETKYIADGDYFFPYDKIATFTEGAENEYLTDRQSDEACRFVERNKDTPFFLYLSYYSAHTRLEAPAPVVAKYRKKFDAKYGAGKAAEVYGVGADAKTGARHPDNPYLAAMLEGIDDGVGRLLQTLREQGLAENTLVVFFSDNGGPGRIGNNGNLRAGKTWLYEGGIRDPLIMRWPGHIQPGQVSHEPVTSTDFYPTFIAAAGATAPQGQQLDGINLLPLLTEGQQPQPRNLFWHYPSETGRWKERMASAVRQGDYKLLYFYARDRYALYNLKDDPGEQNNLARQLPGKTAALKKLLAQWKKDVNAEEPVLEKDPK
ncbi:sulfatase [Parapedobacter sp. 10938]|uniref:sulfatase n=1 Tax=Parapedobacter flavus TaxID=3110225 RepID=UPI002DBFB44B|nr:sulfatase [Parapedobacter sp. 10938]MEC3880121.1 sulfatase [Parapedobacter sp. 10938]